MSLGPVMLDVSGPRLTEEDRKRLSHPLVGGVILFSRNYESPGQLAALTREIHELRNPHLLIGIDQEGGRVQRCKNGFTRIPPMQEYGLLWDENPAHALHLAEKTGFVLASELRACGVDFSFAPVLDMDYGRSGVIGSRAFHRDPQAIADLAHRLMLGFKKAGMAAVGKHFPGHGYVEADSHHDIPVDGRQMADLEFADLVPFKRMIDFGLPAMMPAHVIYPAVDSHPAGFSARWLRHILREQLGFSGVIFSDDLSMEGASVAGDIVDRARAALSAGCDMVLVCNDPAGADRVLHGLHWEMPPVSLVRLARMHGRPGALEWTALHESREYAESVHAIAPVGYHNGELPLTDDPTNTCGKL